MSKKKLGACFYACLIVFSNTCLAQVSGTVTADPQIEVLDQKQKELLKKEQEILQTSLRDVSEKQSTESKPKKNIAKKEKNVPEAKKIPTPQALTPIPTTTPTSSPMDEAQATIAKLKKELDETHNRLALSETEVERLSLLIDNRQKLQPSNKSQGSSIGKNPSGYNQGLRVRDSSEIQAKVDGDMQIATVTAEKAQLRTGPGMNNSPLMTVAQGTRLAVETKTGDWYRVIAPSGARAWVSSDVLDIGGKAPRQLGTSPQAASSGQDNGGFPTDAEVEAFKALQFNKPSAGAPQ